MADTVTQSILQVRRKASKIQHQGEIIQSATGTMLFLSKMQNMLSFQLLQMEKLFHLTSQKTECLESRCLAVVQEADVSTNPGTSSSIPSSKCQRVLKLHTEPRISAPSGLAAPTSVCEHVDEM